MRRAPGSSSSSWFDRSVSRPSEREFIHTWSPEDIMRRVRTQFCFYFFFDLSFIRGDDSASADDSLNIPCVLKVKACGLK